jgi:uncharacterized protein (DUF934 family)
MPLLDQNAMLADGWVRGAPGDSAGQLLVALPDLDAALDQRKPGQDIGVIMPNTASANDLARKVNGLSLIAVEFPGFSDGRGFSIGKQLRLRGFKGRLRAVGPLIPDQFAYALQLGFDEIEVPQAVFDRTPFASWQAAARSISQNYQRGMQPVVPGKLNILDQRRAARAVSHA